MPTHLDGVFWVIISLVPLILLQRGLQKEVQAVLLLITRRPDLSITLFSVLFFPGVLLHEGSHYLMARLVGVSTGRFSIIPRPVKNGRLQLGYVETASADWIRDSLIGMAPLLAGGAFVAYAGAVQIGLLSLGQILWQQGIPAFGHAFQQSMKQPDFWLWIYLALVVSSTMLPSESDRRAWLPLGLILAGLVSLSLLLGAGAWLLENLAEPFNLALKAVALVFLMSAALHLGILPFVWMFRKALARFLGLRVVL